MCVGYGPATRPTLKKALRHTCLVVQERTNTESVLSLGNSRKETSLGVGLLEKIVEEEKGIFSA